MPHSPHTKYARYQPQDRETILCCTHVLDWWKGGRPPTKLHWYMLDSVDGGKTPVWIEGEKINIQTGAREKFRARFSCICQSCEELPSEVLTNDFYYEGSDPIIEVERVS